MTRESITVPKQMLDELRADLGRVGGELGWYGVPWAWRLRMAVGRLFGERMRLHRPERLDVGSRVDWWTAARVGKDQLVLVSDGWFCGDGWLGFSIRPEEARLDLVAAFRPKGLLGLAYWQLLRPVHRVVFRRMARHRLQRATYRRAARRG